MPEILHEQKGLTIKRNDKNKVVVVTLFFYADPLKARPSWIEEASIGMSKADVNKEYYIDYTALQGERTFPEIAEHRDKIVMPPPFPDINSFGKFWAGFDYGTRNPSAFIIFAEGKNPDGEPAVYAIWEHYEPTKNLDDLCDKIKECEYYPHVSWVSADPMVFFKNQQTNFGLTSIGDQMYERGITNIVPGNKSEESFISYIHTCWADLDKQASKFYILNSCPNLIREMENIVYASESITSLKSNSPKEQMINRDNHAIDATKYFFNSYPGLPKIKHIKNGDDMGRSLKLKNIWRRHLK